MRTVILEGKKEETIFSELDEFVFNHPDGSFFQTSKYFRLFLKSKLTFPVAFIRKDEKDVIKGVLISIIQCQQPSFLKFITSRSVIIGGPLAENNDPDIIDSILSSYDKYISSRVIYSQFRNLSDISPLIKIFEGKKYYFEEHLNILIDLKKSEEQLWKELHSKRRNEIRKAEKEELYFKCIEQQSDFEKSYKILKSLYSKIKLPIYQKEIFFEAFSTLLPEGYSRFFGAYYKEELVGIMVTFCYKRIVYNWFAGSNADYYKKYPNDFLPWKIFLWAKEKGFSSFNWGGAGKPNVPYGVRVYKEKFGGEFVNFGRFEKIHKPFLYLLAKKAFILWQKIK